MISRKEEAEKLARILGITDIHWGTRPEDKSRIIAEYQKREDRIATESTTGTNQSAKVSAAF